MAGLLRHATAEGRLTAGELEERLEALFAARTYGELDTLVADLPVSRSPRRPPVRVAQWAGAVAVVTLVVAVLGMFAIMRRHAGAAVVGVHLRQYRMGPLADPHHAAVVMASTVGVFALLSTCAALAWVLTRSRGTSSV